MFGPEGAEKSQVAYQTAEALPNSALLFNGSDPSTWHDVSWYNELDGHGIQEGALDPRLNMLAIKRCYRAANGLLRLGQLNTAIIDPDLRSRAALEATAWHGNAAPLSELYGHVRHIADGEVDDHIRQIGVHVTVAGNTPSERSDFLAGRFQQRGASFSSITPEQNQRMLEACDDLEDIIRSTGEQVVRIETNDPASTERAVGQLVTMLSAEPGPTIA